MTLNDLFQQESIDPQHVIVLRHQPKEPKLRQVLPWLAAEHHDLFNAYQRSQGPRVEKAMQATKYVAAFIADGPKRAVFVGLYRVVGSKPVNEKEFWRLPENAELRKYGMAGFVATPARPVTKWFNLESQDFYSSWKGRLIVDWPGKELSWYRRADRNKISVRAILEESKFDKEMPDWHDLSLPFQILSKIPTSWRSRLSAWRGVYYIFDESDHRGYVGSAGGTENLFGRWRNYAASGHGGNKLLRSRDPENFTFSILELVAPSLSLKELGEKENSWKLRLQSRFPHGLNNN